jgi:hypothetical protein
VNRIYFNKKSISYALIGVILAQFLWGCATTRPNLSVTDTKYLPSRKMTQNNYFLSIQSMLAKLAHENSLLSSELGKLPEFQKNVSFSDVNALIKLLSLYKKHRFKFNHAFKVMYQTGDPEIRRFNALLQALYWLIRDNKTYEAEVLINDYHFEDLLVQAWVLTHNIHLHQWQWRTKEAAKLYNSCNNQEILQKIREFYAKNKGVTDYIIALAQRHPECFGYSYKPFEEVLAKHRARWNEFDMVADRVNSPELVHYYIMTEFTFEPGEYAGPKKTFHRKSGNSAAVARLGRFLLKRAGYKTFKRKVRINNSLCATEHTGAGIVLDGGRYLLVVDFPKGKMITGPYDLTGLDQALSKGHCQYPSVERFLIPVPEPDMESNGKVL